MLVKFHNKQVVILTDPVNIKKVKINTVKNFQDISFFDINHNGISYNIMKCNVNKFVKDDIDNELAVCIGHVDDKYGQYPKYVFHFNNKMYCSLVWHNNLIVKIDGYSYFYEVSVVDVESVLSDINFGDLTV